MWATILMGDVKGSGNHDPILLANALKNLVAAANADCRAKILSPLTITLGDEFQGLCHSVDDAVDVVLELDHLLLTSDHEFRMRFIVLEGMIDTPINRDTAYGMLGRGLSEARKRISDKAADRANTQFQLADPKQQRTLSLVFEVIDEAWDLPAYQKNRRILDRLLFTDDDDRSVAEDFGKNRSEIWKYRKNWRIRSFRAAITLVRERLYK